MAITITYQTAHGTAPAAKTYDAATYTLTANDLPELTATNYRHRGWATENDGDTLYAVGDELTQSVTMYADWAELYAIMPLGDYRAACDAVRAKTSKSGKIKSGMLDDEISSIQTGVTPSGSISITQNGTYDVTNKASAAVNVPAPNNVLLGTGDITPGTYFPGDDYKTLANAAPGRMILCQFNGDGSLNGPWGYCSIFGRSRVVVQFGVSTGTSAMQVELRSASSSAEDDWKFTQFTIGSSLQSSIPQVNKFRFMVVTPIVSIGS